MSRILITGILGVLGSKLEVVLKQKGHDVFGLDLYDTDKLYGHELGQIEGENYFRCDISKYRQLEYVLKYAKPDIVYNAAANFGRWSGERNYEQVWESNVIGLKNLIRLREEKFNFKIVHFSSSEIYGDWQNVMYEDLLDKVPIVQMNDYAMSKRVNEMQLLNSKIQFGTEYVICRFFNTYGPGESYHPFRSVNCIFTYNLLKGKPITVFKGHKRSSTYIDDAINAISVIADNFKSGETYNIACAQEHTIEYLVKLILEKTGADSELVNYVNHHEILTTKRKRVDNSKAIRDLGFKSSVSLEEGVEKTVVWMKEYYKL